MPGDFKNQFISKLLLHSTSSDGTARLWNAATGRETRRFKGGGHLAAFSRDGQFVALCGSPSEQDSSAIVQVWDVITGKMISHFKGNLHGVYGASSIVFSPDGRNIFMGSKEGESKQALWSIASGKVIKQFDTDGIARSAAFSSDGRFLLIGDVGSKVQLWDVPTGQPITTFQGFSSSVASLAVSSVGQTVLISGIGATLWDFSVGKPINRFEPHYYTASVALSGDGQTALIADSDGGTNLENISALNSTRQLAEQGIESGGSAAISSNGLLVLTASPGTWGAPAQIFGSSDPRLWNAVTGEQVKTFVGHTEYVTSVAFSPDDRFALSGSSDKTARLWDIATGKELIRFEGHSAQVNSVAFSPDGKQILTGSGDLIDRNDDTARLWNIATGTEIRRFESHTGAITSIAFSPDGKMVLTGSTDHTARLWDTASGKELRRFEGHSDAVLSVAYLRSEYGTFVLTGSYDATTRIWDPSTGRELCRLVSFSDGRWIVVDSEGHFDTNNLENIQGLSWIMSDNPFQPLPIELFLKEYYEPRLLPRILAGQKFRPVKLVSELNRIQPRVVIKSIEPQSDNPWTVAVTVEVSKGKSAVIRNGKNVELETGVYDLRLFREGQLVGYAPETGDEIRVDQSTGKATKTFKVRLPRNPEAKPFKVSGSTFQALGVDFYAYAFNMDGVKSLTDKKTFYIPKTFDIPADLTPLKGRAYLITVGVNAYQNPDLDLRFAANDARRIQTTLVDRLAKSNQYDEVAQIPLISDYEIKDGQHVLTEKPGEALATKDNFKTVLDLLAGRKVDEQLKSKIPNADKIRQARPEDMIIISFASHGYADNTGSGNFYFIPYDTGNLRGKQVSDELLSHAISSEELSLWLRDVDAGEMAMIVDACQSAAAVGTEFKPGPMGSRGLGQLSYDKGMRILTATQTDNVALENNKLEQGLLTYALIRDGLEAGKAFTLEHTSITLTEWLKYGEKRVPDLYDEVKSGKLRLLILGDAKDAPSTAQKVQKPSLFDFSRKKRDTVLFKQATANK